MNDDTSGIRLLHVDDEPEFAELVATFLEREDNQFQVEIATGAREGLDKAEADEFDCIVSDYDMPDLNGIEFLESVRQDHPELPFILFTGKGSEEVASDAISAGATDYLQKGSGTDRYALLANRTRNAVESYRNTQRRATLERIRTLVNDVNQALVRASTRQDIERQVCDIFANADPYRLVVFAELDPNTKQIKPSTWAGRGEGFLDEFEMSVAADAPGRQAPGGRAYHEREIAIAQDIQSDPSYEQWRDLALEHGFQALAVVPLEYDAELFGFLAVFADRPQAFDDSEQELLEELGDDISHAMASVAIREDLEARQQELERYEAVTETVQDGICVLNRDSEFVLVNDAFVELTNYPRDELLGNHASLVRPEELDETFDEMQAELEAENGIKSIEMEITPGGGDSRTIEARYGKFSDGEATGRVGVWRDITDRKEREQELKRFQAYTERMRDTIDDLFFVQDTEGNLQQWNATFAEVTGYSDENIASMKGIEFVPEDHRERTAAAIKSVFETGHAQLEAPLLTKSGKTIPYEFAADRVEHPDGEPRLVGVGRNITERKEREQELRESERRYRTLAENFPNGGVFLIDENLRYQLVTGSGFDPIEMSPDDLIGNRINEVDRYSDEIIDLLETTYKRALEGQKTTTELNFEGKVYDVRAVPLRDSEGSVTQVLAISQEITERKEQQRELKRKNDRLEEFAGVVSHDLQNPLSVMEGRLKLAREECDSEHLESIKTSISRMNRIIEDLLLLARQGKDIGSTESVNLQAAVETAWNVVGGPSQEMQFILKADGEKTIQADEGRLAQLLENMFANALDHGDGAVTVGALDDGFYVEDDGPGIPDAERETVFDAGYSTTSGGTGFGLSIVKQVAEAHNWDIQVTESSNGGARFEITGIEVVAD